MVTFLDSIVWWTSFHPWWTLSPEVGGLGQSRPQTDHFPSFLLQTGGQKNFLTDSFTDTCTHVGKPLHPLTMCGQIHSRMPPLYLVGFRIFAPIHIPFDVIPKPSVPGFTADILTYCSRETAHGTNVINKGWVPLNVPACTTSYLDLQLKPRIMYSVSSRGYSNFYF